MAFSKSEAVDMYKRITIDFRFFKLESLHNMPICFTDNRFYYKPESYLFDLSDFLKPVEVSVDSDRTSCTMSSAADESLEETVTPSGSSTTEKEEENDEIDPSSPIFGEALTRLNGCLTEDNLASLRRIQQGNLSEDEIIVGVGIHLIQKLSGKAETNKKKSEMKCPCGCNGKLGYEENMYIGNEETWHGELEMLSHGLGVTATKDIEETGSNGDADDDDNEDGFQGELSNLELKISSHKKSLGILQFISQAVVFGWTEYNRHRHLSPYIPSVYIDKHKFLVLVYNPVKDTLMIAIHSVKFIEESLPLPAVYSGIFALWIVLNHRLFFKKQVRQDINEVECGFKSQVTVKAYEKLTSFKSIVRHTYEGYKFVDRICLKMKYWEH